MVIKAKPMVNAIRKGGGLDLEAAPSGQTQKPPSRCSFRDHLYVWKWSVLFEERRGVSFRGGEVNCCWS
jgi:hypothetical protein